MDDNFMIENRELRWKNETEYHKSNMSVSKKLYKRNAVIERRNYFSKIVELNEISSILELGCNEGANLDHISKRSTAKLVGIDICENAIRYGKDVENINADLRVGSIYDLSQFKDNEFDLVFTCGVLMHILSKKIPGILSEMIRISKRFIFHVENNSKSSDEVVKYVKVVEGGKEIDVPHVSLHNYKNAYKGIGYNAFVNRLSGAIGGGNHFIYPELEEKLVLP